MKKYNNSNDAISMLNDYTDYMKNILKQWKSSVNLNQKK